MMTRRAFLAGGAAALSSCATLPSDPYGGFRMGMESWCVRKFDLDRTLATYRELGLTYAEIYPPSHMPDRSKVREYTDKLKAADVAAWGVWTDFTKDEAKNRAAVEFARALGARVMPGSATPDSFESIDRLTRESGIPFALHNDGPKAKWSKVDVIVEALSKWPVAVGACVDTGNFIRSGEDPIRAIRALGPRIHNVHLKDSDGQIMSTVMGKGKLDLVGTLRALREVGFRGFLVLEYEQNPDDPMADLKECLARIREAIAKL